jgi:hypothetical protein
MNQLYNELVGLLTDYENQDKPNDPNIDWENEFYALLVKIQNQWDEINKEN